MKRKTVTPLFEEARLGRPPIAEADRLITVGIRLTQEQKAKLARIGGAQRIREWLDRVRED
jgi:hypothetical protein